MAKNTASRKKKGSAKLPFPNPFYIVELEKFLRNESELVVFSEKEFTKTQFPDGTRVIGPIELDGPLQVNIVENFKSLKEEIPF